MAKKYIVLNNFTGGIAGDEKEGPPNSFAYSQSVDFRRKPTLMSHLPRTVKDSGATVVTELRDSVVTSFNSGDTYWVGGTRFYRRTGAGVWSVISSGLTDGSGIAYRPDQDTIYIMDQTTAHQYYPVSNSPTLTLNKYTETTDQSDTGTASTYNVPTVISEAATGRQSFTPTIEPLYSIKVYVTAKGTSANWTLTLHDDANNSLGTVTKNNADLTNGQLNEWVFSTPVRMLVKPNARVYHWHMTVNNTTGTPQIGADTLNDLETAAFESHSNKLVSSAFHPAILFQQNVCIGNERYLSVYEPLSDVPLNTEWQRHRLTFPSDYEVIGLALYNEFLAIACRAINNVGSVGTGEGAGIIFFWDGFSTTYNFFLEVPEGAPTSLFGHKNTLYWVAKGAWYKWTGGNPQLVRRFPGVEGYAGNDATLSVGVNASAIRRGIILQGYPRLTQNTAIPIGVYSYGSNSSDYPDSFGYDHVISTGTTSASANTGVHLIKNYGDKTFIAWQDGASTFGVDVVEGTNNPYAVAKWESLIFDNGAPSKDKLALTLTINFVSLPTGATVTPKYKINRAGSWTSGSATTTGTEARLTIGTGGTRFREIQFGMDLVATTATPEITGVTLEFDTLGEEEKSA